MKKSFITQPLFWILLVLFAPAGIIYALVYSSKQAEEIRKVDENEINQLSKVVTNTEKGSTNVSFIYKKNPLQFLLLSNPSLIINDSNPTELINNTPLVKTIPNISKIRFAVPYLGSEAGVVEKALKLETNQNYEVEFKMGLFVFSPATVKVTKK